MGNHSTRGCGLGGKGRPAVATWATLAALATTPATLSGQNLVSIPDHAQWTFVEKTDDGKAEMYVDRNFHLFEDARLFYYRVTLDKVFNHPRFDADKRIVIYKAYCDDGDLELIMAFYLLNTTVTEALLDGPARFSVADAGTDRDYRKMFHTACAQSPVR